MELSWIGSVQSRNRVWLSWVWVESDSVQIVIVSSTTPITAHCLARGGVSLNQVVGFFTVVSVPVTVLVLLTEVLVLPTVLF